MKQIAHRAGVAISTVSMALRNDPSIPERTRQRIANLAEEMGYRPNPLVSALMSQLHKGLPSRNAPVIAMLHGWTRNPQLPIDPHQMFWRFSQLYERGARRRAEALGYGLEKFNYREPGMTQARLTKVLLTRNIAGLLIAPLPCGGFRLELPWEHFAAASIGETLHDPLLHRAVTNHFAGMQIALEHLRAAGFHRIGFAITRELNDRLNHHWLGAFAAFNESLPTARRVRPCLLEKVEAGTFERWFRREKPDALIASETLVRRCLEQVARVPEEVAFAELGVDRHKPAAAGIDQEAELVGTAAIDLIVAQLHRNERGIPERAKTLEIGGVWVDGPTVKTAGARDI